MGICSAYSFMSHDQIYAQDEHITTYQNLEAVERKDSLYCIRIHKGVYFTIYVPPLIL